MIGFIDAFYVHSLVIKTKYSNSQLIFSRILFPWLPRIRSILVLDLRLTSVNVKVKVTLRLAVYHQSVRPGVKHLETHDQRFIF
jgi:hypothetical protein